MEFVARYTAKPQGHVEADVTVQDAPGVTTTHEYFQAFGAPGAQFNPNLGGAALDRLEVTNHLGSAQDRFFVKPNAQNTNLIFDCSGSLSHSTPSRTPIGLIAPVLDSPSAAHHHWLSPDPGWGTGLYVSALWASNQGGVPAAPYSFVGRVDDPSGAPFIQMVPMKLANCVGPQSSLRHRMISTWGDAAPSPLAALDSSLRLKFDFDGLFGSDLMDHSSYGVAATVQGTPRATTGHRGSAIDLNGVSDSISQRHHAGSGRYPALTLASWIQPRRRATQALINKMQLGSVDGYELGLSVSGRPFVRFRQASMGNTHLYFANGTYPTDGSTWMHVCATHDGSTVRLYLDGLLDASYPTNVAIVGNTQPTRFGSRIESGTLRRFLDGAMDDLRVYSRAVSALEVRSMAGTLPPMTGFRNLGGGTAPTGSPSVLTGVGSIVPGSPIGLSLNGAPANASTWLIVGDRAAPTVMYGLTFATTPLSIIGPFSTGAFGELRMPYVAPLSPSIGAELAVQYWTVDPVSMGLTGSNGLLARFQ